MLGISLLIEATCERSRSRRASHGNGRGVCARFSSTPARTRFDVRVRKPGQQDWVFFCSEPHVLRSCLLFSVVFLSFWLPRRIAFGPLTWIPGALSHSAALLCLSSSGSTLRILFCCVLLAEAADVRMGSGGSPIHHILSRGTAIKKCSRRDPKECRLLTLSNIFPTSTPYGV